MLLALGDDTDEIADDHHRTNARNMRNRGLVHSLQCVADEVTVVGPGIRRPHNTAVQHARHTHVVHKSQRTGGLGRYVDARRAGAHDAVVLGGFQRRIQRQRKFHMLLRHQRPVGHRPVVAAEHRHQAITDRQQRPVHLQHAGSTLHQPGARLGRRSTQGHGMNLYRRTGNGRALVGCAGGIAQHHVDAGQRDIELFRDDLAERRADTGPQVHMAVQGRHTAVVPDSQQDFNPFERIAAHQRGLAGSRRRRGRRLARDQQDAAGCMKVGACEGGVGAARHDLPACAEPGRMSWAARLTALRISRWVPQRHRLPDNARRISSSVGSGLRASSATVIMIMPLRQ